MNQVDTAWMCVLLKIIGAVIPLRASVSDEGAGLDITQHGEEAYLHGGGASARGDLL